MDRPAREPIRNARELEFAVFCIENVADAMGLPSDAVYRALTGPSDILNQYIVPSYDVLHTQGRDYIVNDIREVMAERGVCDERPDDRPSASAVAKSPNLPAYVGGTGDVDVQGERNKMRANKNLLRMKFARVVEAYAQRTGCSLDEALKTFYGSQTYVLMRDGIADMHCMSIPYLVEEILSEREHADNP